MEELETTVSLLSEIHPSPFEFQSKEDLELEKLIELINNKEGDL